MKLLGNGIKSYDQEGHIILILDSSIHIEYFLIELRSNKQHCDCDILILSPDKIHLPSQEPPYHKILFMVINQIDFETLDVINIKKSKAVFIFCNKSIMNCLVKEKITELLLLQINQFNFSKDSIYIQSLYYDQGTDIKKSLTQQLLNKVNNISKKKSLLNKKSSSENIDSSSPVKNIFFKRRIPIFKIKEN